MSSVHIKRRTGNESGLIGHQEFDGGGNLPGFAMSASRQLKEPSTVEVSREIRIDALPSSNIEEQHSHSGESPHW